MLLSRCCLLHLPWQCCVSRTPVEQPCHPPHRGLPLAARCRIASAPVLLSACRQHPMYGLRTTLQHKDSLSSYPHQQQNMVVVHLHALPALPDDNHFPTQSGITESSQAHDKTYPCSPVHSSNAPIAPIPNPPAPSMLLVGQRRRQLDSAPVPQRMAAARCHVGG